MAGGKAGLNKSRKTTRSGPLCETIRFMMGQKKNHKNVFFYRKEIRVCSVYKENQQENQLVIKDVYFSLTLRWSNDYLYVLKLQGLQHYS